MEKKENDIKERTEEQALDLSVPEEKAVQAAPKGGIIKSVGDFFGSAFGGKSQDINGLIEEFTSEMTLVAEGLSQDQDRLNRRCDQLEARQAESEERLSLRVDDYRARSDESRDALRIRTDENRDTLRELDKRLQKLEEKQKKLEERAEKAQKAESDKKVHASERWSGLLRQATWLLGIVCGAWVIVTIINKL